VNLFDLNTATILALVLSLIIPLVSALLARIVLPEQYEGVITIFLAAVTGFFTQWASAGNLDSYDWHKSLGIALFSFLAAVAAHFGVWKSTSVEAKLKSVGPKPTTTPGV
jgi:hypothetical protein